MQCRTLEIIEVTSFNENQSRYINGQFTFSVRIVDRVKQRKQLNPFFLQFSEELHTKKYKLQGPKSKKLTEKNKSGQRYMSAMGDEVEEDKRGQLPQDLEMCEDYCRQRISLLALPQPAAPPPSSSSFLFPDLLQVVCQEQGKQSLPIDRSIGTDLMRQLCPSI